MDGLVTAPGLRNLMNQILLGDSELDAFVIDHFPQVQRLYGGSMDRIAKVNLLFERVSHDQIYASLCARYPNAASNGATASRTNGTSHPIIAQTLPSKIAANGECTVRYFLVLTGTIDEVDEPKLRALVSHIRKLADDADLTLEAIKSGSIILHFRGTAGGLERLREAFQSGQLREIMGYPLERIQEDQSEDVVQIRRLPEAAATENESGAEPIKNRSCLVEEITFRQTQHCELSMSQLEAVLPRQDQQSSTRLMVSDAKLKHMTHQSDDLVLAPLVKKTSLGNAQLVPMGRRRPSLLPAMGILLLLIIPVILGKFSFPATGKVNPSLFRIEPYTDAELHRAWRIRSLPIGVEVRDAATRHVLGQTPLIYRGPLRGSVVLILSRPGYEERRLTLSHDDPTIVTVKLRRSKR